MKLLEEWTQFKEKYLWDLWRLIKTGSLRIHKLTYNSGFLTSQNDRIKKLGEFKDNIDDS